MSKRVNPFAQYAMQPAGVANITKRLKTVERKARFNTPELKVKTYTYNGSTVTGGTAVTDGAASAIEITTVAQGTGVDDRIGDQIRIHKIEVRGIMDPNLDFYIFKCSTTSLPAIANFGTQMGAYVLASEGNKFHEYIHYRNLYSFGSTNGMKITKKFSNGLLVKYNAGTSGSCVYNKLCYVVLNHSGAARNCNFSVRVWYTDA